MTEANKERILCAMLEELQPHLDVVLKCNDSLPSIEKKECVEIIEKIKLLSSDIKVLTDLIDPEGHRKFIPGEYYADENGKISKCEKRTDRSVWFGGARNEICKSGTKDNERMKGCWTRYS